MERVDFLIKMRAGVGLTCIVLAIAGCSDPEQRSVEDAVRATLADPGSAQFRDLKRCSADRDTWAGEVNSKNQMGGYAGSQPFYFSARGVRYAEDGGFDAEMVRCHGAEAAAAT